MSSKSEIYGTLGADIFPQQPVITIGVDKPFVQSWSVLPFEGRLNSQVETLKNEPEKAKMPEKTALKSGDLLRIFNTVSDGDIHWQGTVKFEWERTKTPCYEGAEFSQQTVLGMWIHGLQENLEPEEWGAMFFDHLPARLEKVDGTVVFGALEPFFETGTEGVIWSVAAYDHQGGNPYDALHTLKDGDKLTVYSKVRDGHIAWEGKLDFEPVKDDASWIPMKACPKGVDQNDWRRWGQSNMPVIVNPGP